jgi:membrane protein DedA with SNARE-associated domain
LQHLITYVSRYGPGLIFANVLVEQLGIPLPSLPTLIVAGALAARGELSAPAVLLAALTAALLADSIGYALGRRHGHRILRILCRISLSPDSCVRQTEGIFARWGMGSLLVSKFIPGFSTVAPPLAGAIAVKRRTFLAYDALGILLWAGSGVGLGFVFHRAIERVIGVLETLGTSSLVLVVGALFLFVLVKWWERRRFHIALRMARITVEELRNLIGREEKPFIVDVRTEIARRADPRRIPGAMIVELSEVDRKLTLVPRDREIVLYCT